MADAVGHRIKGSCLQMPLHRARGSCWQPVSGRLWEMQDSFCIFGDFVKQESEGGMGTDNAKGSEIVKQRDSQLASRSYCSVT